MKDYEKIEALIDYLLEHYNRNDPDYKAAEPFLDQIKEYFKEYYTVCYSYSDFCDMLADLHGVLLFDLRYSIIVNKDHMNPNDWEKAKENALLVSNDGTSAVMSWRW